MNAYKFYSKLETEFLLGSPDSELNKKVNSTEELVEYAMNAFAASKLEEVREKAKERGVFGAYLTPRNPLNNIFDETLKELK